jgi:hypothetical protein
MATATVMSDAMLSPSTDPHSRKALPIALKPPLPSVVLSMRKEIVTATFSVSFARIFTLGCFAVQLRLHLSQLLLNFYGIFNGGRRLCQHDAEIVAEASEISDSRLGIHNRGGLVFAFGGVLHDIALFFQVIHKLLHIFGRNAKADRCGWQGLAGSRGNTGVEDFAQ